MAGFFLGGSCGPPASPLLLLLGLRLLLLVLAPALLLLLGRALLILLVLLLLGRLLAIGTLVGLLVVGHLCLRLKGAAGYLLPFQIKGAALLNL